MVSTDPVVAVIVALAMVFIVVPVLVAGYAVARYAGLFSQLSTLGHPFGVDWRAALGPTVLFVVAFGGLSATGRVDVGDDPGLPVVLAFTMAVVGLFGVALAVGNFGRYRALRAGTVVGGVAETDGTTTPAPLSGEPCLAWTVRVREHVNPLSHGYRPTAHREHGGVPFRVRGDVEAVRADPEGATLDVWGLGRTDGQDRWRGGPDGVPDRVATFATERGLGASDDDRIYEEVRIAPGDEVTVLGAGDGYDTVVANDPVETVRSRVRRRVRAGPTGLVVAAAGFLALVALSGP